MPPRAWRLSSTLSLGRKSSVRIAHSPSHLIADTACVHGKRIDVLTTARSRPGSFHRTAAVDHVFADHISARRALLFRIRWRPCGALRSTPFCRRCDKINQMFPGIYCLVSRRFD
jgi:hypothetical protein